MIQAFTDPPDHNKYDYILSGLCVLLHGGPD